MSASGNSTHATHAADTLAARVADATGVSPTKCYQCGRCAAGCFQNVPGEMDVSPTRIMHLLQLESAFADEPQVASTYARQALSADTCWLCAGCMACTSRCPQGLDIAGTMDVLRQESLKRGLASQSKRARDIQALHRTFLQQALSQGRIHELFMVMAYKLRTGHWFQDATVAPTMFRKGKLRVLPEKAPSPARARQAAEELKRH